MRLWHQGRDVVRFLTQESLRQCRFLAGSRTRPTHPAHPTVHAQPRDRSPSLCSSAGGARWFAVSGRSRKAREGGADAPSHISRDRRVISHHTVSCHAHQRARTPSKAAGHGDQATIPSLSLRVVAELRTWASAADVQGSQQSYHFVVGLRVS